LVDGLLYKPNPSVWLVVAVPTNQISAANTVLEALAVTKGDLIVFKNWFHYQAEPSKDVDGYG
jgi:hypothetical protein